VSSHRIEAQRSVEADIEAAFEWYESEQPGLGLEFLYEVITPTEGNQMRKTGTGLFLICGLLAIGISTQAQTPTPTALASDRLTPAQAINLRNISDLRFSPDGEQLAFVLTEPVKGTTRARHIWMFNLRTRELSQFTNSPKSEDSPRWSPDGKRIAFLSNRDESRQIYLISLAGGEAKRLTETKQEIASFAWSPNGKQIVFSRARAQDGRRGKERERQGRCARRRSR